MKVETRAGTDRARATRIFWIVVITVLVEVGLYIVVYLGPAMAGLMRPVYYTVAAIGAVTIWHALRRRVGHDRRHADRRSKPRDVQ